MIQFPAELLKQFPWVRAVLPLLAIPASVAISCRLIGICSISHIALYQWPSWLACYAPYWAFLYFHQAQSRPDLLNERPGKGHPLVAAGLNGLNAIYAGTTMRFAATAGVLLFWKDEEYYKPIYIFLSHLGCFFLFQLACVVRIKK